MEKERPQRTKEQQHRADYYQANKAVFQAKHRAWHVANRDKVIAKATAWNKANPEKRRLSVRKCTYKTYGTTPEAVDMTFEAQGRKCACCLKDTPGHKHGWQVHHIHQKGSSFVVLCAKCNRGSATFRDDPVLLSRMADINLTLITH
jgi:hypothetical protein